MPGCKWGEMQRNATVGWEIKLGEKGGGKYNFDKVGAKSKQKDRAWKK